MLLNCCIGEDSWESLGLQGIKPVHPKENQSWMFIGSSDAETEAPVLWPPDAKCPLIRKDPDAGKDWKQEEKGMTGWDGWMASLTQWTWVWVSSGSWWWTGKPGVLQSVGLQSDMTEQLNWTELKFLTEVSVILRALLNSDQPHFKCSADACGPWLPYRPEKHGKV